MRVLSATILVLIAAVCLVVLGQARVPGAAADGFVPTDQEKWDQYLKSDRIRHLAESRSFYESWEPMALAELMKEFGESHPQAVVHMQNAACDAAFRHYQREVQRNAAAETAITFILVAKGWAFDAGRGWHAEVR